MVDSPQDYQYDDSWAAPPAGPAPRRGQSRSGDLAAVMLWVSGALQGLVFMCCSLAVFMGQGQGSSGELSQRIIDSMPAEQVSQTQAQTLRDVLPVALVVMGSASALIALLGAGLLVLGFAVRRGSDAAAIAALIILGFEALVLGGLMLFSVLGSLIAGDLLGAGTTLILVGGLLILIGLTFFSVLKARRAEPSGGTTYDPNDEVEPWNAHLR